MKTFDIKSVTVTSTNQTNGDVVISGSARVTLDGTSFEVTSGTRLTALQIRGGASVKASEDTIAKNLMGAAVKKAQA